MSQRPHPHKSVAGRLYLHVDALAFLPSNALETVSTAEALTGKVRTRDFNVVKLERSGDRLSLLNYPSFFDEAFPTLTESWQVDIGARRFAYRTYKDSLNPPILHRKELMLADEHPRRPEFEALTHAANSLGLFRDPSRIGFREHWLNLVRQAGYRIAGHELVPLANDETPEDASQRDIGGMSIARHRTALARSGFSAPVQALARCGLIHSGITVFDYGCGRGDDIRSLKSNGIEARGWDPHYAAAEEKTSADVVNLGFVINVIESVEERAEALRNAYRLSTGVLAVAAMLRSQDTQTGRPYRDGFVTSRNTFQKYYTQAELAKFITDVLAEDPVPVSPGVFFVFRDKTLEQRFRIERQRSTTLLEFLARPESARITVPRVDRAQIKYDANREALEALWSTWMRLGREPDELEVEHLNDLIQSFGSLPRTRRFIAGLKDTAPIQKVREARISDITVYFALAQFARREPYSQLDPGLQRDIRSFFGDYKTAQVHAKAALFKIASIIEIETACRAAAERGLGWLDEGELLQLHTSLIERLPPILRIYVACGAVLYGDVAAADLVKIHVRSGKLTLMTFDEFLDNPLPRMTQRVKLSLRSQETEIFEYGERFPPPYLYFKSRYINEEFPRYAEQVAFDEKLANLDSIFDFSGYGPAPQALHDELELHRWSVEGFDLIRATTIPKLDDPCGLHLTYRQLIECGETQSLTGLPNIPKEPESYVALRELAVNVLDPVIEWFGSIKLTFGFCSPELARRIPGRIAPELDQHAAYERNQKISTFANGLELPSILLSTMRIWPTWSPG